MAEKRKWFDRLPDHLPEAILAVSRVAREEADELLHVMHTLRGPKVARAAHLMAKKAYMRPPRRLATNLKELLDLVATENVRSVIPDGLTQEELQSLIILQTHDIPQRVRETAQGLLNVYERYMLLAAVGRMFREEKACPWEVGLVRFQITAGGGAKAPPVSGHGGGRPNASGLPSGQECGRPGSDQASK